MSLNNFGIIWNSDYMRLVFKNPRSSSSSFKRCVFRNSSTESVFHFSIATVSLTIPSLSRSFMIGSSPRKYLICRLGNLAGRSLLTNACICGYAGNLQVHTSKIARAYFFSFGADSSLWQHCLQCSTSWSKLKSFSWSQEEHRRFALMNPREAQSSVVKSLKQFFTKNIVKIISNGGIFM